MEKMKVNSISGKNLERFIPGIVNVFRDDEVVPWHRYDECLAWVTRRVERGFYISIAYHGDKIVGYSEWIETYVNSRKIYFWVLPVIRQTYVRGCQS